MPVMRYQIEFYKAVRENINGLALYDKVEYTMTGVHADALVAVLKEIQEKGYTVSRLVIPGVNAYEV